MPFGSIGGGGNSTKGNVGISRIYPNADGTGIIIELANGSKFPISFNSLNFMKLSNFDKDNDGIIDLADKSNFAKESETSRNTLKFNNKESNLFFQKDTDTTDNITEGFTNKFLKTTDKQKLNNLPLDTNSKLETITTQTNVNKLDIENLKIDNTKNRNDISKLQSDIITNSKDELVKLNATDTADYLGNKIDNTTIAIQNDKLVAKTLDGLTVTLAELNMLQGAKGNIQSQINSFTKGMEYKGQVNTHADLLALSTPQSGWTVIVKVDENYNNKKMFYIYDGTKWEATYEVSATSMGRDFLTDGIDLSTETKGILPKEKISTEIARQIDLDKKINKVTSATQDNIVTLNSDGTIKDSGKKLSDFSESTHTHTDLEDKIKLKADKTELHNHINKDILDKLTDNGTGLKYDNKEIGGKQILEFALKTDFPVTGEENKIYVDKSKNIQYRWDTITNGYIAYNNGSSGTGTGSAITVIDNTSNTNKEITTNLNKLTVEGNASVSSYVDGEVKVKINGLAIENDKGIVTNNANTLVFEGMNVNEENHKIVIQDREIIVNTKDEIPVGLPNDTRIFVRSDVKVGYKPSEYLVINGVPQLVLDDTGGGNTVQTTVDGTVINNGKLTIQYPATSTLPNIQVSKFENGKTNQNYVIETYDDVAINNYNIDSETEIKDGVLKPKTEYIINSDNGVLTDSNTYKVFMSEEIDLSKFKNIESII